MIKTYVYPKDVSFPENSVNHRKIAEKLKESQPLSDYNTEKTWRDVLQSIPASRKYVKISLPGDLEDYEDDALNSIVESISEIKGVEYNKNGWVEIQE